jgi:hypothetical protein
MKKLKKLYLTKTKKYLLSLPENRIFYTSLAYRDDYYRRGLNELKLHSYFEQFEQYSQSFNDNVPNGED